MPGNRGILREDEFVYFLNGKKAKDLSNNFKNMLESLFGVVDLEKKVKCEKTLNYIKPDVVITYRRKRKAVSIKSGTAQVVHTEQLKLFILYLREQGISEETQKTLLCYFYGDGTLDGTGKKRYSQNDMCFYLKDKIKAANDELNKDPEFVKRFVDRIMFSGVDQEALKADAIYHGDMDYGVIVTKEMIFKHIASKKWNYFSFPHIGPLGLISGARYIHKKELTEEDIKRRNRVECYWPKFAADMQYIAKRYDSYSSPYLQKSMSKEDK